MRNATVRTVDDDAVVLRAMTRPARPRPDEQRTTPAAGEAGT
jgi:hypothetical protein